MKALRSPDVRTESSGDARSIDPIIQTLLICARPKLDAALQERLRALAANGLNWNALVYTAQMNLLVPLMAKHLGKLATEYADPSVRDAIISSRNHCIIRMMRIEALRRDLVHNIIEPLGARYALLKGVSLSRLLYAGDLARQYRDVDVLLDEKKIVAVVTQLIAKGCRITNKEWEFVQSGDISVLAQYLAAVELKTLDGIPIEIHRRLDNSGCVFDSQRLLSSVGKTADGNVLPEGVHATYMCFHHARHKWSMLHWCADIAALRYGAPERVESARAYSISVGLDSSIDESLKLAEDLHYVALNGTYPSGRQSKFLADCIQSLNQSIALPLSSSLPATNESEREPDFYYSWQKSTSYHIKFTLARCSPNINDYNAWPLTQRWRWLYWLSRPIRVLAEHLRLLKL
jgi:hypothetical protein